MKADEMMFYVADRVPLAAMLEQTAEECAEACHALLKAARVLRNENPTPVTYREAWEAVKEELNDVMLCAEILDCQYGDVKDSTAQKEKLKRWVKRLDERQRVPDEQER